MDQIIRVALVDHQLMFSELLAARIDGDRSMKVVGIAVNGNDARRLLFDARPDVAVLEVDLPGQDAFQLAAESVRQGWARVIFLTNYLSDVFIAEALRANACGYLLKADPVCALIDGIRRVQSGGHCFSETVRARIEHDDKLNRYRTRSESRLRSLSSRQVEILRQLAKGQSVKEVAQRLRISEKAVDSHKYRIMHRLEIHDRVELARYAIREGLTVP